MLAMLIEYDMKNSGKTPIQKSGVNTPAPSTTNTFFLHFQHMVERKKKRQMLMN